MPVERIKIKCMGCGSTHVMRIDTDVVNPKKLKLNACRNCTKEIRKREFEKIEKHEMKPKWIPVKNVPGMFVLAEIKPIKTHWTLKKI